ncbi:MAG TPA: peptidoglycan DD-metalloendopeptidase family protein [Draconibacterium sp.]|jgi:murein hydrolase activator|nr:peptidoglycan DD-metalloendopeptidase family protein [Draconibacterium sp.]
MRILLLTGFLIFNCFIGFSQSIDELQKKKQEAENEIKYTTKLLSEVQKNQKLSLNRLQLLNRQIEQRNAVISTINSEINLYQQLIDNNTLAIRIMTDDIKNLKKEYAELIRSAYRNRNAYDQVLFLLSAENANQAYRRYLYMRHYTTFRQGQAEIIEAIQEVLNIKAENLEQQKLIKIQLVSDTKKEAQQLSQEKTQKNSEVQKLQREQQDLRKKLQQQRDIEQRLEREIQKIIEEEARKSKAAGTTGFSLTPEQKLVGDNFAQNKKRLPWPVERGVITEHFGINQHPVLANVQTRNNGISIATEAGAKVRAIFNGEVSRVFGIAGGNTAVIIRHGKYLTVYSNLREVTVKMGDKVTTKQTIGTVFTDAEDGNKSILKFQIWLENQKLNPEDWIGR